MALAWSERQTADANRTARSEPVEEIRWELQSEAQQQVLQSLSASDTNERCCIVVRYLPVLRARYSAEHGHDLLIGVLNGDWQATFVLELLPLLMELIGEPTRYERDAREVEHHFAHRRINVGEQERRTIPKAWAPTNSA